MLIRSGIFPLPYPLSFEIVGSGYNIEKSLDPTPDNDTPLFEKILWRSL